MRAFVFLYPIKPYVDAMWYGRPVDPHEYRRQVAQLNHLIAVRYRRLGYKIFWAMFCLPNAESIPDMTLLAPGVRKLVRDPTLVADVSFRAHCKEKKYPSLPNLLMQIPTRPTRLVVGGFHNSDCVEKFAEYAHRQGINTFVDEDTTELFFVRLRLDGSIPPTRSRREAATYIRRALCRGTAIDQMQLDYVREQRKHKPWRPQL